MMMHHAMNQLCKVCGEPAAGFHFGAFTCEGCKSFFGRTYNNLSSLSECKNNGRCVINKKNRTSCKSCRLRKCLMVGMSKSGSRYGRRSNWFKIHCLLQDQANLTNHQMGDQPSPLNGYSSALQSPGGGGMGGMNLGTTKIGYEHDERVRVMSGCGDSSSSESGVGMKNLDDGGVVSMRGGSSSPESHDDDDSSKMSSNGSSAPPTLLLARAFGGGDPRGGPPPLKNGSSGGNTYSSPFSPGTFESPSPPTTVDKSKDPAAAAAAAAAATAAFLFAPSHQLPISPISPLSPLHQPTKFLFSSSYLHSHQHHHHHHAASHLQQHHHSLHQHHQAMVNGLNGYASKLHPAYRPFLQPTPFELMPNNKSPKEMPMPPVADVVNCCTAPEQEIPIDLSVKKAGSRSPGTSVDDDDARSPLSPEDCSGDEGDREGSLHGGDCDELAEPQSPLDLSKSKDQTCNENKLNIDNDDEDDDDEDMQVEQHESQSSPPQPQVQYHEQSKAESREQKSPSSVHE